MTYRFTIEGRIKPKERPRRARSGHFYTPSKTLRSEGIIALAASQAQIRPIVGPIAIEARFFGKYGACDLDNMVKTLLDGLKDYFNDRQVVAIRATKTASSEHYTEVEVSDYPTELSPK